MGKSSRMSATTSLPLLKRGSSGTHVRTLQSLLQSQGFYPHRVDGDFGNDTAGGLSYFQATHLNSKGDWLDVTATTDPETWWALQNPSGAPQRSNLDPRLPRGLSDPRRKLLQLCVREHLTGVREIPDGANYGDGVSKYLDAVGKSPAVGPAFWCMYTVSFLIWESTGTWPLGARHGGVHAFYKAAQKAGLAFDKNSGRLPLPGDIFIMLYGSSKSPQRSGHTGLVGSLSKSGQSFNTWAGNEGNRFKYGVRNMDQGTLVGFVSLFGEDCNPQRLLVNTSTAVDSIGGTR